MERCIDLNTYELENFGFLNLILIGGFSINSEIGIQNYFNEIAFIFD